MEKLLKSSPHLLPEYLSMTGMARRCKRSGCVGDGLGIELRHALLCRHCKSCKKWLVLLTQHCKCPGRVGDVLYSTELLQASLCCRCQCCKQRLIPLTQHCKRPDCVGDGLCAELLQASLCCHCQCSKQWLTLLTQRCNRSGCVGDVLRNELLFASLCRCLGISPQP